MNEPVVVKNRKKVAQLIFDVLLNKKTVLVAIKNFPKVKSDLSVNTAFHALVHLEADEDIRKKDGLYAKEQDEYLYDIATTLSKGDSLPFNVISQYDEYYTDSLIYPKQNKKTILESLKKIINL